METMLVTLLVCLTLITAYWLFGKQQEWKKEGENEKKKMRSNFFRQEIDSINNIQLLGISNDGNSDFNFKQAVKKINLSDDIRIKIND